MAEVFDEIQTLKTAFSADFAFGNPQKMEGNENGDGNVQTISVSSAEENANHEVSLVVHQNSEGSILAGIFVVKDGQRVFIHRDPTITDAEELASVLKSIISTETAIESGILLQVQDTRRRVQSLGNIFESD